MPGLARRLIRSALDHAATALMDLLPVGASWMICSEYVYRSFDEAIEGDTDPYELAIAGISFGDASASGDEILIDWALKNVSDVQIAAPATFGAAPAPRDHVQRIAAIEADLAPLVADYADRLYAAGEIADEDLPPLLDASFGPPAPLPPEPTDEDLLASIASFTTAFSIARPDVPVVADPSFGVGTAIGAAALKGALEGIRKISVDGNFVTPGDLLKTPSLEGVGKLG
jgi:hypothetical protein